MVVLGFLEASVLEDQGISILRAQDDPECYLHILTLDASTKKAWYALAMADEDSSQLSVRTLDPCNGSLTHCSSVAADLVPVFGHCPHATTTSNTTNSAVTT